MILDDLQKSRQMMLKNTSSSRLAAGRSEGAVAIDQRSLGMVTALETSNHPTTWAANNSNYGNPILPVFPRFDDDQKKEESNSSSSG